MNVSNYHNLWPCYVKPESDELFSSWLMRLSSQHLLKSHTFSKIFFENTPIWNRDIDIYAPEIIRNKILFHTKMTIEQVDKLFLKSYEGILFTSLNLSNKLISKIGVVHRKRKHYGLKYCPGCFENSVVYYKKCWRLKICIACINCRLYLRNSCPTCNSPICFHRLENGFKDSCLKKSLTICYNCNRDLRYGNIWKPITEDALYYQQYIDTTINVGFNQHCPYSFHYFKVLINTQRNIVTSSKGWNRIKTGIKSKYNKVYNVKAHEQFDSKINLETLLLAYHLLDNWPKNLVDFSLQYNIRYSDFTHYLDDVPFFLYEVYKNL